MHMLILEGYVGPIDSGEFEDSEKPGRMLYWASAPVQDRTTFETDHIRGFGEIEDFRAFKSAVEPLEGQYCRLLVKPAVRSNGKGVGLKLLRVLEVASAAATK